MRIILTTFGTLGDVRPVLATARALQERGAEAIVVGNPFAAPYAERAGVSFRPAGEYFGPDTATLDPRFTHPFLGSFRIWSEVYMPQHRPFFEVTEALIAEGADLVLNHVWCYGAMMAAEKHNVPWGTLSMAPITWFSISDPSIAGDSVPPARLHGWMQDVMFRKIVDRTFKKDLDQLAQAFGLPYREDRYFLAMQEAVMNIGLWSPHFRGTQPDDPPNAWICGFPYAHKRGDRTMLASDLRQFIEAGEPPVVMGLGSAFPQTVPETYRHVYEACARLGERVIFVGAPDGALPADSPHVFATDFAPYEALFREASMIIHHGGIGSMCEAYVAQKPQLILSIVGDQHDNAWRSKRLGVARWKPAKKLRTRTAEALIRDTLVDHIMRERVQTLGSAVEAEPPGAEVAAERVISWVQARAMTA